MSIQQAAAQSLIERALNSDKQSEAGLLIDAALRIDPTIPAEAIKTQWLEKWLIANQHRNGEPSQ